ncbi:transcriptional repressor NrdR [Candidatus Woesearchaeota archaeon]|nr:MAG: transcriptional repressor NrdR [Candidatus Woesearchaeota archaeon]
MKCPYCLNDGTRVVDKRENEQGDTTRRRRECLNCGKRFTTYERVEQVLLTVVKKSGEKQPFEREKLLKGIKRACEKRPITDEMLEDLADSIELDLRQQTETEIPTKKIGEAVMKHLKKLDKVAYVRFASVYREFADLGDFEKEVHKLLRTRK